VLQKIRQQRRSGRHWKAKIPNKLTNLRNMKVIYKVFSDEFRPDR
jgi:hypothetical protein